MQSDAAELAKEALECKAKEENLIPDAVKQLHEAKSQISSLSIRIVDKAEESKKQKEEIAHLLTQVHFESKSLLLGLYHETWAYIFAA